MTIDATYGGNDANSYLTLTEANDFITSGILNNSAWTSASTAQKEASLREATRDIDSRQYRGIRYFSDQHLEFPRELRENFPFNRTELSTFSEDTVQARMRRDVQEATSHQAVWLLRNNGSSVHQENVFQGIRGISESVGPIREFVQYGKGSTSNSTKLHPNARTLLAEWMTTPRVLRK